MKNPLFLICKIICILIGCSVSLLYAQNPTQQNSQLIEKTYPAEKILNYDVEASFNEDGSMLVTENIKVNASSEQIKHGIFRTLPLIWQRSDGKTYRLDYRIKEILREGQAETFIQSEHDNHLRLQIGDENQVLTPGLYRYQITYLVKNHFSRFDNFDELYWNVTGNDWSLPIDKVTFHLNLPNQTHFLDKNGKDKRFESIEFYTGMRGAKDQNAQVLADGSIQTTEALELNAGLTVVYTWPHIYANQPILLERSTPNEVEVLTRLSAAHFIPSPNNLWSWYPIILFLVLALFYRQKLLKKLDLKMPPIIATYDIPATFSPGYVRTLYKGNYDRIAFSSDLLDSIARKFLIFLPESAIVQRAPDQIERATNNDLDNTFQKHLFSAPEKQLDLNNPNVYGMQKAFNQLSKKNITKIIAFKLDKWELQILYGLTFLALPIFSSFSSPYISFLDCLNAVIITLIYYGSFTLLRKLSKSLVEQSSLFLRLVLLLCSVTLGLLTIILFMATLSSEWNSLPDGYLGALISIPVIYKIIVKRLPKYNHNGLKQYAIVLGIRRYLTVAEEKRLETLFPPDQIINHFEKMLPYAIALDVGETWANRFSEYITKTGLIVETDPQLNLARVNRSILRSTRSISTSTGKSSSGGRSGSGSRSGSSGGGSGGGGGGGW